MYYDFLGNFPRRMKNVGLYATLIRNIVSKTTWKDYGFDTGDEQINLVFSVLLFIMEKSLKEENCTMDDITSFVDNLNDSYYKKALSFDDCAKLGDFIVNVVLSNEGKQMFFDGFDYAESGYVSVNVRYLRNQIVYLDNDVRRTSYLLTDDGYSLLLSTLEVESNLRITIQEMIFRLHLEKQSYDKAVDDIRNIFHQIRIQYQKIRDAMLRIRKNALDYSVGEYETILGENLDTIGETKAKFEEYRRLVETRAKEFETRRIDVRSLSAEEEEKLKNLRIIGGFLDRTIEEHQRILGSHMELKELYTKELEDLSQAAMIKRFSIQTEVYDRVLEHPESLENLDVLLGALYRTDVERIYNPGKALLPHKTVRRKKEADVTEEIGFDEEEWEKEQERLRKERRKVYEVCLGFLLDEMLAKESVSLREIREKIAKDPELIRKLIPEIAVFKEVMVELIRNAYVEIDELKNERKNALSGGVEIFELNRMLLDLLEQRPQSERVRAIRVEKDSSGEQVLFENMEDADGAVRNIRCSDVRFTVIFSGS